MRHENSSLDAVIPVLRQLILAELLVRSAGKPQYRVELARRLGVPASSLQRPLAAMVRAGILTAVNQGREVLYGVNRESPLIPELESLVRKTRGLADVVRGSLKPLRNRIRVAFIYGSMATGSEGPSSDVDLFVIGQATLGELSRSLASAEQVLQREVNAIVRTPEEFIARLGANMRAGAQRQSQRTGCRGRSHRGVGHTQVLALDHRALRHDAFRLLVL